MSDETAKRIALIVEQLHGFYDYLEQNKKQYSKSILLWEMDLFEDLLDATKECPNEARRILQEISRRSRSNGAVDHGKE